MRPGRLVKVFAPLTILLAALFIWMGNWTMPGTSAFNGSLERPCVELEIAADGFYDEVTSAERKTLSSDARRVPHYRNLSMIADKPFHETPTHVVTEELIQGAPPHLLLVGVYADSPVYDGVYNAEIDLSVLDGTGRFALDPLDIQEIPFYLQFTDADLLALTYLEQPAPEEYLALPHEPFVIPPRYPLLGSSTPEVPGDSDKGTPPDVPLPRDDPPKKVPEPETFILLGAGLVCVAVYLRLRKRQSR